MNEAGEFRPDAAGGADERFLTLDAIIDDQLLEPHKIAAPKTTVAYLGYSSGTSGKAKGVRTSAYNMTVSLRYLLFTPCRLAND